MAEGERYQEGLLEICFKELMDSVAIQGDRNLCMRARFGWKSGISFFLFFLRRKWQPTPVFLPGDPQGWGSMVGCPLWGLTESDTTEVTWHVLLFKLFTFKRLDRLLFICGTKVDEI